MKRDGWYSARPYAHFDRPLAFSAAWSLVADPARVKRHGFHPFLQFERSRRRYKARKGIVEVSTKHRPISVAAHIDGYIYAYYAKLLSTLYERALKADGLDRGVLAYRAGFGSNIDFAGAAFDEIGRRDECVVIAADLEDFFGSIDHGVLKRNWCRLLDVDRLPPDHYAVYKAITRYSEVGLEPCLARLGISQGSRIPRPICTPERFRNVIRRNPGGLPNLVHTNPKSFGIPQGSQISALLSNIYMLDFDREMETLAKEVGGYYRRYSDDILWVCPAHHVRRVEDELQRCLDGLGGTTKLNQAKTELSRFEREADGRLTCDRQVQYLGFTFDGERRRIRSQTLSKFWRRVIYAGRATRRAARRSTAAPGIVYKRKI